MLRSLTLMLPSATTEQCLHINRAIEAVLALTSEVLNVSELWKLPDTELPDVMNRVRIQFLDAIENVAQAVIRHYPFHSQTANSVKTDTELDCTWLGPERMEKEDGRDDNVRLSDHALVYQGVSNMFNRMFLQLFGLEYRVVLKKSRGNGGKWQKKAETCLK